MNVVGVKWFWREADDEWILLPGFRAGAGKSSGSSHVLVVVCVLTVFQKLQDGSC